MRRLAVLVAVVTAAVGIGFVVGAGSAHGATTRTLSFDAAAFIQGFTTHDASPPCPAIPNDQPGSEFKGASQGRSGGMLLPIQLPPGATVTRLRYTILDQADTDDSYVFLLRKRLAVGLTKEGGYSVMARTNSTGQGTTTRQFDSTKINDAVADPNHNAYFLEIVNCNLTLEPIGVQVTMTL